MITKSNLKTSTISWLSGSYGEDVDRSGTIGLFYLPETLEELKDLCQKLYKEEVHFDLVGHTSNTYFLPEYTTDVLISTRKIDKWSETDTEITCECGVSVSKFAKIMVSRGITGYEGLIDLPGTVGAAVYGNASCYGSSINENLIDFQLLLPDGNIITCKSSDLEAETRMTSLKSGKLKGVILSIRLKKEQGDKNKVKSDSEKYQKIRKMTQPGPKNNLGSIFRNSGRMTILHFFVAAIVKMYGFFLFIRTKNAECVKIKKKHLFFKLIGAEDLLPYVYEWNRFIWKDSQAHILFWKYVRTHHRLFTRSDFEIEIKQ